MKEIPEIIKKAFYYVAEFSALFGKERTWGYKLLHKGKLKAVTGYGQTMIPHSEYERMLNDTSRYLGRRRKKQKENEPEKGAES